MTRVHLLRTVIGTSLPLLGLLLESGCAHGDSVMSLWQGWSMARANRLLTVALESENPDRRRKALLDVMDEPGARSPEAFRAVDLVARTDKDASVRRAAVALLAGYTDDRPVKTLLALLHFEDHPRTVRPIDDEIRWDAVRALDKLAAIQVVPEEHRPQVERTLTDLLRRSGNHHVRVAATRALRNFYSRESIAALIDALSSPDFGVVYEARSSLKSLTGRAGSMEPAAWRGWLEQAGFQQAAYEQPRGNPNLSFATDTGEQK